MIVWIIILYTVVNPARQDKGEEVILGAGKIIGIADGLEHVVLPTCAMKIMNNLIVIKDDIKKDK